MGSRSRRIMELVTSKNNYLLDLPKYESTKGTTPEEHQSALLAIDSLLNSIKSKDNEKFVQTQAYEEPKFEIKKKSVENDQLLNKAHTINHEEAKEVMKNNNGKKDVNRKKTCINKNTIDYDLEELNQSLSFDKDMSKDSCSESEYIPDTPSPSETNCENEEGSLKDIMGSFLSSSISNKGGELAECRNIENTITLESSVASGSKVEHFSNSRSWTKKNMCPYCYREVTHFPRHLKRNHKSEVAVKEFLLLTMKDPRRKQILNAIRRQGNFCLNKKSTIIRPVRRPKGDDYNKDLVKNSENLKDRYIVCEHCMGYFARNFLRRHRKFCHLRPKTTETGIRENHLSSSQLFSVCSGSNREFYANLRLKNEVLKIMKNDDISKTAMGDVLICLYGESLLLKHKRPQIRNVISNKMREIGRLLLSMENINGVHKLFDALKPNMFDDFVAATKIISGYCPETRTFKASSLALHMGTTLKQLCDIATKFVIKKSNLLPCDNPTQTLKDIKQLRNLFERHWNTELSSLALKNLNENKYKNTKLLPLTSDVVKLHKYVSKEAEEAVKNLEQNIQCKANYRRLLESILVLTLLLNRKRIGEVQYLKVETYTNSTTSHHQEEFLQCLSESEKALTKSFKRVITLGKGSKPVPILFSKDMQKYINVLLQLRPINVNVKNEYLFANTNTDERSLSGYHTIKKLAEQSGVSDVSLFTSTRLRKQIATILQVLNVTENEMEQLASFLGHTKKTHQEFYRLPQDIYQTAKMSKLLLAINSGKGHLYQGKTLDDIEMSDSNNESIESETECCSTVVESRKISTKRDDVSVYNQAESKKILTTNSKRKTWTAEQKEKIKSYFSNWIVNKKPPRKNEVEKFIKKHPALFRNLKWNKIKSYVYNCYK